TAGRWRADACTATAAIRLTRLAAGTLATAERAEELTGREGARGRARRVGGRRAHGGRRARGAQRRPQVRDEVVHGALRHRRVARGRAPAARLRLGEGRGELVLRPGQAVRIHGGPGGLGPGVAPELGARLPAGCPELGGGTLARGVSRAGRHTTDR